MSDYLAVGGVSVVLKSLLTTALTSGGPSTILGTSPGITATSPDLVTTGSDEPPRLNLFMYYASLNPALRNLDLPSVNAQGNRLGNPPLAVNLHYLVSAYGANQFDPEILLAWAMQVFHDTPVVPRQTIQQALTELLSQSPTPETQLISGSTLANQVEHIRITPEALTTEEIYRLWTAFQTSYRPTTSYQVSVVVIQATDAFSSNLPVQRRTVMALPMQTPVIANLAPSMVGAGQVLTITGSNFLGDAATDTLAAFDSLSGIAPDTVQATTIRVTLPTTLLAGTHVVRVQRTITYALSPTPHAGFSSSPAPFQLVPAIQNPSPVAATQGAALVVSVSPPVGQSQRATLYIGDTAIPIDERPVTDPVTSSTVTFPIPSDLPTGTFPLRIEIDGAQSALTPSPGGFMPQVQVSS
jgi:hypothetical protein